MISKSSWEYIKAKDLYFIKTSWVNKGETTLDGFPISLIGCTMMPGSHKRGFVVFIFVYLHWNKKCSVIPSITWFTGFNRTFLLKWPAAMETYWNKRLVLANMAAVSLFWNTNMANVTSCENALFLSEAAEYCRKVNIVCIWLSQEFKRIVISQAQVASNHAL